MATQTQYACPAVQDMRETRHDHSSQGPTIAFDLDENPILAAPASNRAAMLPFPEDCTVAHLKPGMQDDLHALRQPDTPAEQQHDERPSRRLTFHTSTGQRGSLFNGMPALRDRASLLRTVSHLGKDQRSTVPDAGDMPIPSDEADPTSPHDSVRRLAVYRPFHHSEMAQPPIYSPNRTVRQRLSLDIRRSSRNLGGSSFNLPESSHEDWQERYMRANQSSSSLSNGRLRSTRSMANFAGRHSISTARPSFHASSSGLHQDSDAAMSFMSKLRSLTHRMRRKSFQRQRGANDHLACPSRPSFERQGQRASAYMHSTVSSMATSNESCAPMPQAENDEPTSQASERQKAAQPMPLSNDIGMSNNVVNAFDRPRLTHPDHNHSPRNSSTSSFSTPSTPDEIAWATPSNGTPIIERPHPYHPPSSAVRVDVSAASTSNCRIHSDTTLDRITLQADPSSGGVHTDRSPEERTRSDDQRGTREERSSKRTGLVDGSPDLNDEGVPTGRIAGAQHSRLAEEEALPIPMATSLSAKMPATLADVLDENALLRGLTMPLDPMLSSDQAEEVRKVASALSLLQGQKQVEDHFHTGSQLKAFRTPSSGIDEEHAAIEQANLLQRQSMDSQPRTVPSIISAAGGGQHADEASTDGNLSNGASGRRSDARSSRLSHLPRLSSARNMRTLGGRGGGDDDEEDDEHRRIGGYREDAPSDDERLEDQGERDEEARTGSEVDSDEESFGSDDDEGHTVPGAMPLSTSGRTNSSSTSEGRQSRRPSGIALPPAPSFTHLRHAGQAPPPDHASLTQFVQDAIIGGNAADAVTSAEQATPTHIGRGTWMQFSNDETPGWLPTPRASAAPAADQFATPSSTMGPPPLPSHATGPTTLSKIPQATPESPTTTSETSYFNIRPVNTVPQPARSGTLDANAPPPSPSVITRSRAQSSASLRSMRTPTIPNRDLPPMPPVSPFTGRGIDRALSPKPLGKRINVPSPILASPSNFAAIGDVSSPKSPPPPFTSSIPKSAGPTGPPQAPSAIASDTQQVFGTNMTSSRPSTSQANGLTPLAATNGRPGLYKQESKSLIDLTSSVRKQGTPMLKPLQHESVLFEGVSAGASVPIDRTSSPAPSSISAATGPRRRRSMYEVGAAPPPYSIILSGPKGPQMIYPREEEGRECLPDYNCSVHIEGYLPRKMEFSSPGVQAKDRSWRRQYFVLHGTCLRVYKTDLSNERAAAKGQYGPMLGSHVHLEPMNEDGPSLPPGVQPPSSTGKVHGVDANSARAARDSKAPVAAAAAAAASTTSTGGSPPSSAHTSSTGSGGLQRTVEAALTGTISHIHHPFSQHRNVLVKQYTLQGAESGLAADYLKRRHVVRVRAEGEQFLLQTRNDRHVVDWIEAFQASTNVALDLERRPMPKFITLPRRRRRRRREGEQQGDPTGRGSAQGDGLATDLAAREAAEIAEARRRSLADSNASITSSRRPSAATSSSLSSHPPRPLGLPGDESPPDPSAAFEEMLRQEHEDQYNRDAGDL